MTSSRGDRTKWAAGLLASCLAMWPARAQAADIDVQSDNAAQFYDVRSPTGETILNRRRFTTTLAVSGYDLITRPPNDPTAPELLLRVRLRYDADYGANGAESTVTSYGSVVPGFAPQQADVMYGYIEGRRFLKGYLGFKIGRQYVTDVLGWYSFDGGEVRVTTPLNVAVEAYGGLEQRGGMPLSTARFESDGIWRGDRTGYDPSLYPSFQQTAIAPLMAAAVETTGTSWLHARLTYRRVLDTGSSNTSELVSGLVAPTTYSGTRDSSEKLGYSMDAAFAKIGAARAGLIYDFYDAKLASAYANLDAFLGHGVTAGIDYQFYQPTFEGDSIWNFFLSEPMNDVGLRMAWKASDQFGVSAGGHARIFTVQTSEDQPNASPLTNGYFPSSPLSYDGGGDVQARYKFGEGHVAVRASGSAGPEGDRIGGDLNGERILDGRYVVQGRVSLWQWNDNLRPDRDATSFGYVLGLGYHFAQRARTLFEFEQDTNRLVGLRFRAMLYLTLAVTK